MQEWGSEPRLLGTRPSAAAWVLGLSRWRVRMRLWWRMRQQSELPQVALVFESSWHLLYGYCSAACQLVSSQGLLEGIEVELGVLEVSEELDGLRLEVGLEFIGDDEHAVDGFLLGLLVA